MPTLPSALTLPATTDRAPPRRPRIGSRSLAKLCSTWSLTSESRQGLRFRTREAWWSGKRNLELHSRQVVLCFGDQPQIGSAASEHGRSATGDAMADDQKKDGGGRSWPLGLGGVIVLLVGLVASAISGFYLEISLNAPSSFAELSSVKDLTSMVDLKLDFGTTEKWRGYIGESRGSRHQIEEMTVTLKQLTKYKRVTGELRSSETGDEFSMVGFLGGPSSVLVDLGRTFGVGAYFLKPGASSQIPGTIYFGYLLANVWRDQPGGDMLVDKCPFVLVNDQAVQSHHITAENAGDTFGFLMTPCTEFKMPMSLVNSDSQ